MARSATAWLRKSSSISSSSSSTALAIAALGALLLLPLAHSTSTTDGMIDGSPPPSPQQGPTTTNCHQHAFGATTYELDLDRRPSVAVRERGTALFLRDGNAIVGDLVMKETTILGGGRRPRVTVKASASSAALAPRLTWREHEQVLLYSIPAGEGIRSGDDDGDDDVAARWEKKEDKDANANAIRGGGGGQCIALTIEVHLPAKTEIESVALEAESLDVALDADGLDIASLLVAGGKSVTGRVAHVLDTSLRAGGGLDVDVTPLVDPVWAPADRATYLTTITSTTTTGAGAGARHAVRVGRPQSVGSRRYLKGTKATAIGMQAEHRSEGSGGAGGGRGGGGGGGAMQLEYYQGWAGVMAVAGRREVRMGRDVRVSARGGGGGPVELTGTAGRGPKRGSIAAVSGGEISLAWAV